MIYVDTSVAVAHLFAESSGPSDGFWNHPLVASELLEYELCVRVQARHLPLGPMRDLLGRIAMLPLSRAVLARAFEPFPVVVRTLDALHLASLDFLRAQSQQVQLATLDSRMAAAARAMGFAIVDLAAVA